jgi:type II secretory ATPase GspE/PulE/Tfp pilus assembly ATPase PilB-like protein
MKIEPFLIVSTVNVIIAQRLVRKLASKEKYFLSKSGIETLGKAVDLKRVMDALKNEKLVPKDAVWEKIPFYKPVASAEAKDGYKGRLGIYEVLKVTPSIKELIIHGATARDVEIEAKKSGMLAMIEDGYIVTQSSMFKAPKFSSFDSRTTICFLHSAPSTFSSLLSDCRWRT